MCLDSWDLSEMERDDTQSIVSLNSTQTRFLRQQNPQQQCFSFSKAPRQKLLDIGGITQQPWLLSFTWAAGLAMRPNDVSQQGTWAYRDGEDGIIYVIVNYLSLI